MYEINKNSILYKIMFFLMLLLYIQILISKEISSSETIAIFLSDNQHTEDYGFSIHEQGRFVASRSKTARRSALNNLFNLDVIQFIENSELNSSGNQVPIIHLGDALNNSCLSEWEQFEFKTKSLKSDWFIAPGNHDSYYLGISYPQSMKKGYDLIPLNQKSGWGDLCVPWRMRDRNEKNLSKIEKESGIFDKREFIKAYVSNLVQRKLLEAIDIEHNKIQCSNKAYNNLKKICWLISSDSSLKSKIWTNFVIQEIQLITTNSQKVNLILLDTTSMYHKPPKGLSIFSGKSNPLKGELTELQTKVVQSWLVENKKLGIKTILAGHHPFSKFQKQSKEVMKNWSKEGLFNTYISAHTHKGFTKQYDSMKEVNVGSLVDYPVEYLKLKDLNSDGNTQFEYVFLNTPNRKRIKNTLNIKYKDSSKYCSSDELKITENSLNSLKDDVSLLHLNSRKDKNNSLLQEAKSYLYLLDNDVLKFKNELTPICYRKYIGDCELKEGKEAWCATYESVKACDENTNEYDNLFKLESPNDLIVHLKKFINNKQKFINQKPGRNLRSIDGSRFLGALREYVSYNENLNTHSTKIKACLSILASKLN